MLDLAVPLVSTAREFETRFGVRYLPHLRDGEDFSGRYRPVARRLELAQARRDEELFTTHGGYESVSDEALRKWRNPNFCLLQLNAAEERAFLTGAVDDALSAPTRVGIVNPQVGLGLFAATALRAGEVVGEYTGVLRRYRDEDATNAYLAVSPPYGPLDGLIIDGREEGNFTRFINHAAEYAANVINQFVFHRRRWHRVLRTTRAVASGEQLLSDYGEDYWRNRGAAEALEPG